MTCYLFKLFEFWFNFSRAILYRLCKSCNLELSGMVRPKQEWNQNSRLQSNWECFVKYCNWDTDLKTNVYNEIRVNIEGSFQLSYLDLRIPCQNRRSYSDKNRLCINNTEREYDTYISKTFLHLKYNEALCYRRKVAGLVIENVNKFHNWPNSSSHTMALSSTQTLIEMSAWYLPGDKAPSARRADNLTVICSSRNLGCLMSAYWVEVEKLKLKLIYDRQSIGQFVLVSDNHLELATNFSFSLKFSLDSCGFVIL
jgi:hypothetical protein